MEGNMDQDDDDPYGEKDGILPEDYRFTADLLRKYMNRQNLRSFQAVCSNNLSIILAALDKCGGGES
jgi:hypothetical protein